MTGMTLRPLGRSALRLTPLGLGCWQFSDGKGVVGSYWEALSGETTVAVVEAALQGGINWFDTAEAYGGGASETGLARALHHLGKRDDEVLVATKWFPRPPRTARSILTTVADRLRCLDGYSIALHQVHQPLGAFASHRAQMLAMARLVREGKVKTVGISNFGARAMRHCARVLADEGVALVSNQMRYSLLDRRIESNGVLDAAKELGVTIIAYSPLAQGLLSGKYHDDPTRIRKAAGPRKFMSAFRRRGLERSRPVVTVLREIAATHGVTSSQVALNWTVTFHGDTVVAIPGASRPEQVQDNVHALSFTLSPDERRRIDEASRAFV